MERPYEIVEPDHVPIADGAIPDHVHLVLEDASTADAILDVPMLVTLRDPDDPNGALMELPTNLLNDPGKIIQKDGFDSYDTVDGDPPTLLEEIVLMEEDAKRKARAISLRNEEVERLIQKMDDIRDFELRALAETHLPSRYAEAKQKILNAVLDGHKKVSIAHFSHPLNAYDQLISSSLKRMFAREAMTILENIVADELFLVVMW